MNFSSFIVIVQIITLPVSQRSRLELFTIFQISQFHDIYIEILKLTHTHICMRISVFEKIYRASMQEIKSGRQMNLEWDDRVTHEINVTSF